MSYPVPSILLDSDITFDLENMDCVPSLAEKPYSPCQNIDVLYPPHFSKRETKFMLSCNQREKTAGYNSIYSHAQDTTTLQSSATTATYLSTAVHKRV